MDYRKLGRTGMEVSILGFGASSFGGYFREVDEAECIRTVHTAIDQGINYIDVAPFYGRTKAETLLGKGLREIPRDRYVLATKVGRYDWNEFDFSKGRVTRSVEESLERLGVETIDVIQCHDMENVPASVIVEEALPALHALKESGKVRHVGLTSLPLKAFVNVIDQVPEGTVETILSFCRYTLNDTSLGEAVPYFKARGIGIVNAAPTGMGLFGDRPAPDWHPASATVVEGCRKATEFCKEKGWDILELAFQFAVSHPDIATTLFSTSQPDKVVRSVDYAERPLDRERLDAVMKVLEPVRNFNYGTGRPENRDPIVGDWVEKSE